MTQDPFSAHLSVFRGRCGDLLKVLWWDGQGLRLFAKAAGERPVCLAVARRRQGERVTISPDQFSVEPEVLKRIMLRWSQDAIGAQAEIAALPAGPLPAG